VRKATFRYRGYYFKLEQTEPEWWYEMTMYEEVECKLLGLFPYTKKVEREYGNFDANEWNYDWLSMADRLVDNYTKSRRAKIKQDNLKLEQTAKFKAIADIEKQK
jgi:hypothetical protein